MLEMDDQQSSINASDQFHVAVTANTGRASQHVEYSPTHYREGTGAKFDDQATQIGKRVGEWISDFVTARNGHSDGTNVAVRDAVNALYDADIDTGAGVRSV
ncbi:hypothetical protein IRT45_27800 [Nocardia sp. BSTN01]|uniref:hypothetical protein n=1 Tax=Nocardia sp. BSTN01 TaxID=2783665 RepID=UPI00188FB7B3|nr:hypothetical protein [Nocardia sp. BSTN01]MBF5000948.1 hypothetical protein [Nocardia sp. BSTN01]